jgi:hypothetical protein
MDLRNILGKLDQINEGTMSSAKKKPTGPKFVGKMKGTDPASAAKDKYVGGMEESIFKELEETLQKQPARDLKREFAEFKLNESSDIERKIHRTQALIQDYYKRARETRNDIRRDHFIDMARQLEFELDGMINDANQAEQDSYDVAQHDAEPSATWNRGGLGEGFSDLELAVMEGGHELISELAPLPAPGQVPSKPALGTDVAKQQQQQAQQADAQAKQQADLAKQTQQQQTNLQKGVNTLKQAGAAISNASQTVQAFDKVDDNQQLNPADKNNIASAGTVLAPIMGNQQLAGKFKDLVNQASTAQKKQQQQQAQQAQQAQPAQPGQQQPQQAPAGAQK